MSRSPATPDRRTDAMLVATAIAIGAVDLGASWPSRHAWLGIVGAVLGVLACLGLPA